MLLRQLDSESGNIMCLSVTQSIGAIFGRSGRIEGWDLAPPKPVQLTRGPIEFRSVAADPNGGRLYALGVREARPAVAV